MELVSKYKMRETKGKLELNRCLYKLNEEWNGLGKSIYKGKINIRQLDQVESTKPWIFYT